MKKKEQRVRTVAKIRIKRDENLSNSHLRTKKRPRRLK